VWLEAIITREDLAQFMGELLPVKLHLDNDDKTDRWLYLDRATEVTLVPDIGLRVTCPAELQWSISVVNPVIKLDRLGVLLRPEIVEKNKGHVLEFLLEVEEADFRGVPALIDHTIMKAVNAALAAKPLVWNFTQTLTHTVHLPSFLDPVEALDIGVTWGKRRIGEDALVLAVSFKLGLVRDD
jgi:hypothetical protein